MRGLTKKEMEQYRAPYVEPSDREPLYRWPNEAAIGEEPADMAAVVQAYHTWLMESEVPKLFFYGTSRAIIGEELAAYYRESWKNTRRVDVGPGRLWLVEDNPHLI